MALNADRLTPLIRNGPEAQDLAINILLPFHEGFLYSLQYFLIAAFFFASVWTFAKYVYDPEKNSVARLFIVMGVGLAVFQTTTVTTVRVDKDSQQYEEKLEGYEYLAEDFIFEHLKTNESYRVSKVMWTVKEFVDAFESVLYGTFNKIVDSLGGGPMDVPYELYSSISMNSAHMMGDDNMRKIYVHHHMCGNLLSRHIRQNDSSINMDAMRALGYNSGMLGMVEIKDAHPPLSDAYIEHIKLLEKQGAADHDYMARLYRENQGIKSDMKKYIGYLKNICPLNSGECLENWPHQNSYVFFEIPSAKYWYNQFAQESGEPTFEDSFFGVFKNKKKETQSSIKSTPVIYYLNNDPRLMANPNVSGIGPGDDVFGNPQTGVNAPQPGPSYLNNASPEITDADTRFYPQTCYDTYSLANTYWKEFRSAASLFYDIPINGKHEKRSIVKENVTTLALATLNKQAQISEDGYRHQFLGEWTGEALDDQTDVLEKVEEYGLGTMLELWTFLQEIGIKYLIMFIVSGISFLIGMLVVGFPLVALFSAFPGRLSALVQYLYAFLFLKLVLFLDFVFIKLGTLLGSGLRMYLNEANINGFGFVNKIAILTYGVDAGLIILLTYGTFKISYFLVFNENHGLKSLDFSGFGAGQAAKAATTTAAAAGLATTLLTKGGGKLAGGISKIVSAANSSMRVGQQGSNATSGALKANAGGGQTMKDLSNAVQTSPKQHPGNSNEPFKKK